MTTQTLPTEEVQIGNHASRTLAVNDAVGQCVSERLHQCPFAFYFNRVSWTFSGGTLTLSGCVPTLALKENLEKRLAHINHVQRIVNNLDVICSNGLSYLHPK